MAGEVCNGPKCIVMVKQDLLMSRHRCELERGRVFAGPRGMADDTCTFRTDKEHPCSLLDSGKGDQYCIDKAERRERERLRTRRQTRSHLHKPC